MHTHHAQIRLGGLADNCPRCAEHAKHPLDSLDTQNLEALWIRMLDVEFDGVTEYRSETEAAAGALLVSYARFLGMVGIDPSSVEFVGSLSR